jgi:hypothetical protein
MQDAGGFELRSHTVAGMLSPKTRERQIDRIKHICESFPEVEVRSHQGATFLVRGKKFAYFLVDHHRGLVGGPR